ncbi:hypothetical protein K9857_05245 [Pseudomonas sp. REP124]|uniref:hypothetical protein n=1 Tax=Pseudomonas sp. REP124 TaxID=2875731 RepID=UPI001CCF44EE|nr:hypothetical protein [Pseudomonas sp. REP124]MBZ9780953.1 hypothetical protein [Pseudomonas sp. REP124]
MHSRYSAAQLLACRRFAMEQNKKLFEEANALNRCASEMLEQPDFDSEKFLEYLQQRGKADAMFRQALDHISLLNEQFPPLPVSSRERAVDGEPASP